MRIEYDNPVRGDSIASFISGKKNIENATILDLGCNNGAISVAMSKVVKFVVSGEIEKFRIRNFLKRKIPKNVSIIRLNGLELPFKKDSFDVVIINGVMEHVPLYSKGNPKATQIGFLKGVREILKPNGLVYIGIENRFSIKYMIGAKSHNGMRFIDIMPRSIADRYSKTFRGEEFRQYTHSLNAYMKMLSDSGFSNQEAHIAIPNYQFPRFIIDVNEKKSLMKGFQQGIDKKTYRIGAKLITGFGLHKKLSGNFVLTATK